jgi:hypothetical protein
MNEPSSATALGTVAARRRRPILLLIPVGLLLLAIGLILAVRPASTSSDFTWLTPAQLAQAKRLTLSAKLKTRLQSLIGLVVPSLRLPKLRVWTASERRAVSAQEALLEGPRQPAISTNIDGVQVWLLSSSETSRLKESRAWSDVFSPQHKGLPARVLFNQISLKANYSSGSIKVLFGADYAQAPLVTGLAGCARFRRDGALLFQIPHTPDPSGSNEWLLISVLLTASDGNRLPMFATNGQYRLLSQHL